VSDHASTSTAPVAADSLWDRHYLLFRRLHSLSGIVPVGVFLAEHIFTSSAILLGPGDYQKDINFIWNMPGLLLMEIFGIWLPIAFHAALGLYFTFTGRVNLSAYPYGGNWRYTLQRITGILAMVYIFLHLAVTRWHWSVFGWYTPFDPKLATATTVYAVQVSWWLPWFFLIGVLSAVFHFANGLWTAAITWGLTVTVQAQKRWGYACCVLGIALSIAGIAALARFATYDTSKFTPEEQAVIKSIQNGTFQAYE
jgi:succinate dehydrogenase / fumarate reductase, cytochrome b subunit